MAGSSRFVIVTADATINYGADVFNRYIGLGESFFGGLGGFDGVDMVVAPPAAFAYSRQRFELAWLQVQFAVQGGELFFDP